MCAASIVGLQEYDMTAAVVVRGFLRDHYGVEDPRGHPVESGRDRTHKAGLSFRSAAHPLASRSRSSGLEQGAWKTACSRGNSTAVITLRALAAYRTGDPQNSLAFPGPNCRREGLVCGRQAFPDHACCRDQEVFLGEGLSGSHGVCSTRSWLRKISQSQSLR